MAEAGATAAPTPRVSKLNKVIMAIHSGNVDTMHEYVVDGNFDFNKIVPNMGGSVPLLSYAIQYNTYANDTVKYKVIEDLIEGYADPDMGDGLGNPPLYYAINTNDNHIVAYLIGAGADVNKQNKLGNTPLSNALKVKTPNIQIIETLLDAGANINVVEKSGNSLLGLAIKTNRIDIVELFIQRGADVNILDTLNNRPLDIAISVGNMDIINLLKNKGAKFLYIPERVREPMLDEEDDDVGIMDAVNAYYSFIPQLSEIEQYTLTQYSFHGDVMLNAMLRGTDTLNTYKSNISLPEDPTHTTQMFNLRGITCLFLYIMRPDLAANQYFKAIKPGILRSEYFLLNTQRPSILDDKIMNHWDENYSKDNFRKNVPTKMFKQYKYSLLTIYKNEIYPVLKEHIDAGDLTYFRNMTYDAFKIIFNAIMKSFSVVNTSLTSPFYITYRGVKQFYIPKRRDGSQIYGVSINSFTSTTMSKDTAFTFSPYGSGGIYKFIISKDVPAMYMESITLCGGEYELLLPPGVQYLHLRSGIDSSGKRMEEFFVFPAPESSPLRVRAPETYDQYMEWAATLKDANPADITFSKSNLVAMLKTSGFRHTLNSGVGGASGTALEKTGGSRLYKYRKTRKHGGRVATAKPIVSKYGLTKKLNRGQKNRMTAKRYMNTPMSSDMNTSADPVAVATTPTPIVDPKRTRFPGDRWDSTPVKYVAYKFDTSNPYLKVIQEYIQKYPSMKL